MNHRAQHRELARTLLIDADDTLWENNIFYLACTAHLIAFLERQGFAPEAIQETLDTTEHRLIPTYGYGPVSYMRALGEACRQLFVRRGQQASDYVIERCRAMAAPVLRPPIVLLPGVEATLGALRPTSRLILVTKGDMATQQAKIDRSGLAHRFDACHIVPEKEPRHYIEIVAQHGLAPESTWMVGNSPKSDINPAIEAGIGAIWIPHANTWTAEHQAIAYPDRVIELERFSDLTPHFEP